MSLYKMRYDKPAADWMEGLPIGNGRIAAMVWGDGETDILDLNHEWLWRGINRNRKVAHVSQHLDYCRSLLKKKDFYKATLAANLFFAGGGGLCPGDNRVDPYQTAGFIKVKFDGVEQFNWRELDIENGICKAGRKAASYVTSEFFASCENGLIISEWRAEESDGGSDDSGNGGSSGGGESGGGDGGGKEVFSCSIGQSRVEDADAVYRNAAHEDRLVFDCQFKGGISYRLISYIQTDGQRSVSGDVLHIRDASYVKCITNIATSVFDMEGEIGKYAARVCFDGIGHEKNRHAARFSRMMKSVNLELKEDNAELSAKSIGERLAGIRRNERDNGVAALYFNYGRYLMISSSVCGDLPANLQGIWNNKIDPPWDSDYHFDINIEMNYWMTEQCDMPQCAESLLKYVESFYDSGREAAEKLYGCRGIYLPIQTDAWGVSTPESFGWAAWIGAAPWIAQHFWNRYAYSGDVDYLRDRGYKYLKAVAEFYEDYVTEDESGVFQIMPSQSPENTFEQARGRGGASLPVSICVSSAMDVQLAYDALGYAVKAAGILDVDGERVGVWKNIMENLPGFSIGGDGRLLEWNDEKIECEPGHRHLSHLYGAFPSCLFTKETRPEQYAAAKKSLEYRLSHGGGHTGWSRAWVACLQARFDNPEGFYEHFMALIKDFATVTLLDLHPPGIFQIDGNLGAVSALIESIVSYTDDKVRLLRSLPKEWSEGSLEGIKIPGGHTVSVWWKDGAAYKASAKIGYTGSIVINDKIYMGTPGEIIDINL